LVWLGEIERKLAKLSMTAFTSRSSPQLFYCVNDSGKPLLRALSASINYSGNIHSRNKKWYAAIIAEAPDSLL
jgi:hypothetical protein